MSETYVILPFNYEGNLETTIIDFKIHGMEDKSIRWYSIDVTDDDNDSICEISNHDGKHRVQSGESCIDPDDILKITNNINVVFHGSGIQVNCKYESLCSNFEHTSSFSSGYINKCEFQVKLGIIEINKN
jgi:hypothetical protein